MIESKHMLRYYLECDKIALGIKRKRPHLLGDEIWKYERLMRMLDYVNTARSGGGRIFRAVLRYKYHVLGMKLGFSIPVDVFGPGLAIVHYGTIVVSSGAKIGENCRIHAGVNIGANGGEKYAATIGNNVYIGPGAKIVGKICIGDNVCIGANAVVANDIEPGITIGGIPARKISNADSSKHLKRATEMVKKEE